MKKLLLALLILAAAGGGYLYTRLDSLVKTAVETFGPKLTKTTVTLRRVSLSPFSGEGKLVGLEIGSPAGFKEPCVLRVESIRVKLEPKSLLTDHIVVRDVTIEGPELHYERTAAGANLDALQRNIESFAPAEPARGASKSKPKKITIDRLAARQGKAVVNLFGVGSTLPLPDVELKDLGKGGGASPKEVVSKVLASLSGAALKAVGSSKVAVQNLGKSVGGALKNLFGR